MSRPQAVTAYTLSVVIPLYNEEESLPLLVTALFEVLNDQPDFCELILVNDGSRDRTLAIATDLAAREPRIRVVSHPHNRGLGAAIRTGLESATGTLILYTDADLPFDFKLIPQLLAAASTHQLVMGSRLNRGEGARRWVLTKGYNLLCWLLLGVRVRDINFACKIMPRAAVAGGRLQAEGSFIDAEIVLECRRQGLALVEFPLTYYPRTLGQSTLSRPSVIFGIVREAALYISRTAASAGQGQLPVHHLWRYGSSVLSVFAALALVLALQIFPGFSPLMLFLPAVLLVSWRFGRGPGLLAALLALFVSNYLLEPPIFALSFSWQSLLYLAVLLPATLLGVQVRARTHKYNQFVQPAVEAE